MIQSTRRPAAVVFFVFSLSVIFSACDPSFMPVKAAYNDYAITGTLPRDSSLIQLLKPYSDSVNANMNEVVAVSDMALIKKQPDGSLGKFMADAMLFAARKNWSIPVDAAFVNSGGVRISQLPKGPVTSGKVFELMPFDNILILQQMSGDALQQFLNFVAAKGGWPVAGIAFQIHNGKATNVLIGGTPLDKAKTYTIANSDYIANGGDDAEMLKSIPQQNTGYLMRQAIFDYIADLKKSGKNISVTSETRISNAQ